MRSKPPTVAIDLWLPEVDRKFLTEKTQHRVLQMDGDNPPDCDPARSPAKDFWRAVNIKPTTTPLEIEITISG